MVTPLSSFDFSDDRGQIYTLEAVIAAVLIISGIVFALQATAITPLTASTANERVEVKQQMTADDLLDTAAANDSLTPTVLHWNTSDRRFIGALPTGYATGGPPTAFGEKLNTTFKDRNIAFNMYVQYQQSGNEVREKTVVYQGKPSDNSVASSRTIPLYDAMQMNDGSGRTVKEVGSRFYAKDAHPDSPLYNVVRVKLVVWRM